MKQILLLSLFFSGILSAQVLDNKRPLPSVDIKTIDGKSFNSADFDNGGKPMIINFWATWCKPCIAELTNIEEVYEAWMQNPASVHKSWDIYFRTGSYQSPPTLGGSSQPSQQIQLSNLNKNIL